MTDTIHLQVPDPPSVSASDASVISETRAEADNETPRSLGSVSKWLRFSGAGLVVASAATFILRQWSQGNDESRYFLLLALTAVLGAAGMVCAHGIRDSRGGRTLLGLVIATIPVHFTVLGALLQSRFVWDGVVAATAPWQAASHGSALLLMGAGIGALIPLCWISMMVMVRPHARYLTAIFLLSNAPVLLPVRDPDIVVLFLAAMSVGFLLIERHLSSLSFAMQTPEGRFTRAMMAVPLGIIVGRVVIWYPVTSFFTGGVLLAFGALLFFTASRLFRRREQVRVLQGTGALAAASGWMFVAGAVGEWVVIPGQIYPLFVALPVTVMLVAFSVVCSGSGAVYRTVAGFTCAGAAVSNALFHWSFQDISIAGLMCLVIGIAIVAASIYARRRLLLAFGGITTAVGLAQTMIAAIEIGYLGHWGALAAIGICLVFASAYVERYADRLMHRVAMIGRRLSAWAY